MDEPQGATETEPRIVFNRTDCPYGCGAEVPLKLRWHVTPCPRCQRPWHLESSLQDAEGRPLWPAASVPRPPEAGQPGVLIEYVVTEEDHRELSAIRASTPEAEQARARRARSDEWTCLGCFVVLVVIVVLVVVAIVTLLL